MDGLHTELALGLIGQLQTAPFVAKTYQMVWEPRTDALIRWGRENNSFVVADVAGFSQLLLPCFFKHGNFSSFVRQLNTYGFRKVHPDRWEFAHESFLRGQTHLLPRIVRRKKRGEGGASYSSVIDGGGGGGHETRHVAASIGEELELDDDEEEEGREALLLEEVQRLRREQTAIGEQLARMSRRLQATERRPDQLMSFLTRLAAEDPGVHLLEQAAAEKKRQRMQMLSRDFAAPSSPSPIAALPPPPPPVIDDAAMVDGVWRRAEQKPALRSITTSEQPTTSSGVQQVPEFEGGGGSGVGMGLTDGGAAVETPFPFCLLGQCFF